MNFNRNNMYNNNYNDPWNNPNQPNDPNFYGPNNNGIPPLIQYPNIYHPANNFNHNNQNRKAMPDANWRFRNFQDFGRNKNRKK